MQAEGDIGFINCTMPPIMVPTSQRAKEFLSLPNGAEGAIFMGDPANVLSIFPDDYTFFAFEDGYVFEGTIVLGEPVEVGVH